MVKRDPANNTGRDDCAAALLLAGGAFERTFGRPQPARRLRWALAG